MIAIASIITDASFLDICVRMARLEEKVGGLYWVIGAIALPIIVGLVQNYFLHKQLKNGNSKK